MSILLVSTYGCGRFNNDGKRPTENERCVIVKSFEEAMLNVASKMTDDKLRSIFLNAAPNTLVRQFGAKIFICV